MTETLFGIPTGPFTIGEVAGMGPMAIQFQQWLQGVFAPNGVDGAPDPATDPMSSYAYLSNRARVINGAAQQRPLVRLADKNLNIVAQLTEEMSCDFEELMSDSGHAKYVVRYENWLVDFILNQTRIDEDLHLILDPIPTAPDWRTRWGGKVSEINVKRNNDGTSTVEIQAISHREHAKHLLVGAAPYFPPEFQLPRIWILPGPTRTILFLTFMVNLARLFVPGVSTILNIFNPAGWFDPLNISSVEQISPLAWPIQCAFVNPVLDQSRWSVIAATWQNFHDCTKDMLLDAGVCMRAYTWLTTDTDSPHTELADLLTLLPTQLEQPVAQSIRPLRNCVCFSLEDWSGQHGPTGTAIDGLLNVIGVTLDDLFTSVLINSDTGQALNGEPIMDVNGITPVFETLLGVAPAPPQVIWRDGQFTGIIETNNAFHKAPVKTMMTGGHSPTIVNQAIEFGIKYGLSQLSDMINWGIGTWVNTAFQAPDPIGPPSTPGLDSLYQGQLSDTVLAWQRQTDLTRAIWTGDVAYQEIYDKGTGTAYTLAGILTLRESAYKTRAYQGFQTKIRNGYPWNIDVDVRLGQRAGFEFDGVIYVDQITAIKREYDRKKEVLVSLSVGDDKNKQDPVGRLTRVMQSLYTTVASFFAEGTIFQ